MIGSNTQEILMCPICPVNPYWSNQIHAGPHRSTLVNFRPVLICLKPIGLMENATEPRGTHELCQHQKPRATWIESSAWIQCKYTPGHQDSIHKALQDTPGHTRTLYDTKEHSMTPRCILWHQRNELRYTCDIISFRGNSVIPLYHKVHISNIE